MSDISDSELLDAVLNFDFSLMYDDDGINDAELVAAVDDMVGVTEPTGNHFTLSYASCVPSAAN